MLLSDKNVDKKQQMSLKQKLLNNYLYNEATEMLCSAVPMVGVNGIHCEAMSNEGKHQIKRMDAGAICEENKILI